MQEKKQKKVLQKLKYSIKIEVKRMVNYSL